MRSSIGLVALTAVGFSMSAVTTNENRSNVPLPEPWMRAYGVAKSIVPP